MAKKTTKKIVVVRTYSAGVHVGELAERRGQEVDLVNARRIWSWQGANTLHEIANHGVGKGSKVSESVSEITLTQAIEVIACSQEAIDSIAKASWGG